MTISMNQLAQLCNALVEAEAATEAAEMALKIKKEKERQLREESLPAALQELGVAKITLDNGDIVSVKQEVYCSLTGERKGAAMQWLEDNKFGGLIKTELIVGFAKGELEKAREIFEELRERFSVVPTLEQGVHPQTLKAFLKEQLAVESERVAAGGVPLPLDLFAARPVFAATVKKAKQ